MRSLSIETKILHVELGPDAIFAWYLICDATKPGCPLTTRQPAEIYMSHVMRPIHVQKWPLGPTHHTHKMYILYKNDLITIC